ncbi:MAG: indole-3-glycerol phosphate synthase TrpC [Chloroflexi bacterium]|nr:indole-3-glycerol phosphate synthase TrpC [Chloroflexota bacterium]
MILDDIIAHKRQEVDALKQRVPLSEIRARAEATPPPRDFAGALQRDTIALIAEIKRVSPSRGALNAIADPVALARVYAENGASAISVLTDEKYFHGSLDDLRAVRAAVSVPVLRKDFTVDAYQIFESRAASADAILLIVRVLGDTQLREYLACARDLGLGTLVEIHDERDLARAVAANARVIGINNRNLADFTVDLATTERLAPKIASDKIVVAESGVFTREDVSRAAHAGARAVLVGEALVRAGEIAARVKELTQVPVSKEIGKGGNK